MVYTLFVTNNDEAACGDSTNFNIAITSELGDTSAFNLASNLSSTSVGVAAGGTTDSSVTFTVTSNLTAVDGNALTSTLTISDAINHSAMNQSKAVTTTVANYNPLIHSSQSMGSTKWSGSGGWGVVGGQYGEITCATCHTSGETTVNIKRIRQALSATFSSRTVSFQDATDGADVNTDPADFGDDSDGRTTTPSQRICEVCHTITSYHTVTTDLASDLTHYNKFDCLDCHKHNKGFKATCTGCHPTYPEPPSTGAHVKHAGSTERAYACTICHPQDHDGDASDIAFTGTIATLTGTQAYSGSTDKQCSNLYCHGPSNVADWDAVTGGACGDCHGAAGTGRPDGVDEPTGGSHLTASHAAAACTACHSHDGTDQAEHVNGRATAGGDALVSSAGTSVNSYVYGSNLGTDQDGFRYSAGTCSVSCHADANWGGAGGCTFCHGGSGLYYPQSTIAPNRIAEHAAHIAALEIKLGYTAGTTDDTQQKTMCAYCHNDTNGVGGTGHNDGGTAEVGEFNQMWTPYASDAGGALDAGKTCSNIDCHYNTTTADTWYGTGTATCTYCHAGDTTYTAGTLPGVHDTHVDETADGGYDMICLTCHPTGTYTNTHADGASGTDVTFSGTVATAWASPVYSGAVTKQCSNLYCHGSATADWDAPSGGACGDCHGDANGRPDGIGEPTGGSHLTTSHAAAACTACHSHDGSDKAEHVNGSAGHTTGDALVSSAGTSITSYVYGSTLGTSPDPDGYKYSGGTCATSCHSDGTWGGAGGCTFCHGGSGLYYPQSTIAPNRIAEHAAHIAALEIKLGYTAGTTDDTQQKTMCAYCHNDTNGVGGTGHNDGGTAEVGEFNQMWTPYASDAGGTLDAGKTCSNIDCHYNTTTADTWYGSGTATCTYCHASDATYTAGTLPGVHDAHVDETADGGYNKTCATCHSTSTGYANSHANGASGTDVSFSGSTIYVYDDGLNTCGTASNDGLGCHATGTPDWDVPFASTACTNCHTDTTTTAVNPTSGLHNITVAGPQPHNSTISGGCTACHTTPSPGGAHLNGGKTSDDALGGTNEYYVGGTVSFTFTDGASDRATCAGSGLSSCHSDGGNWTRLWSTEANSTSTAARSARCNVCHGQWSSISGSTGWAVGTTHYKAGGANVATNTRGSGHEAASPDCDNCHGYVTASSNHNTATHRINMNSNGATPGRTGNVYGTDTAGCGICHGTQTNAAYNFPISFFTELDVTGPAFTAPSCTSCHDTGSGGAPVVNSTTGTHIDPDGGGGVCEDCHLAHADGTSGANDVEISTVYTGTTAVPTMTTDDGTTALYSGHSYKIRLGGNATVGKTVTGLSVTFTSPNQINGTGIGSGTFPAAFRVGDIIQVKGSTSNGTTTVPKYFTVTTVTANQLLVAEAITSEAASSTEIISSSATEAQICWNCHTGIGGAGTFGISEWGADDGSNNADTGSGSYNYGTLFTDASTIPGTKTANWTSGVWRSAKGLNSTLSSNPYWYKRGSVRSTHSANYDGTTVASGSDGTNWKAGLLNNSGGYTTNYNKNETKDDVANIRCTYCHDVHGTHDNIKGDATAAAVGGGQPYLRGTWLSNPYPEDGAPRYGMANFTVQDISGGTSRYGVVPRASASNTNTGITAVAKVGGWWIDQNSDNPVAGHATAAFQTASGNAGLCDQCHGQTKDGNWTATEIGSIDQITGEGLWVSTFNGHANSVVGGSMTESGTDLQWNNTTKVGRNIFNRTVRGSASLSRTQPSAATDMGLATHPPTTSRGFSYRSSTDDPGYEWRPHTWNTTVTGTTSGRSTAFQTFAWNTTISTSSTRNSTIASGTAQLTFNTSTTETAHNAQANFHTFSCSKCHNPHASRLPKLMITNCLDTNHNTWEDNSTFVQDTTNHTLTALPSPWNGLRHSQWASAQNCHRLDARATGTTSTVTMGVGWNKATPWIEDTSPNGTKSSDLTTLPSY